MLSIDDCIAAAPAVELSRGRSSVQAGSAQHAVAGTGLSSAFLTPSTWTNATYGRVLVVLLLQAVAVGLFFVLRRVRDIRNESSPVQFNSFKGTSADVLLDNSSQDDATSTRTRSAGKSRRSRNRVEYV